MLTDFQNSLTVGKSMKFPTKDGYYYRSRLEYSVALLGEVKSSNLLQICGGSGSAATTAGVVEILGYTCFIANSALFHQ